MVEGHDTEIIFPEIGIYYLDGEKPQGPFAKDVLKKRLADGSLNGNDYVWHSGISKWLKITHTDLAKRSDFPPIPQALTINKGTANPPRRRPARATAKTKQIKRPTRKSLKTRKSTRPSTQTKSTLRNSQRFHQIMKAPIPEERCHTFEPRPIAYTMDDVDATFKESLLDFETWRRKAPNLFDEDAIKRQQKSLLSPALKLLLIGMVVGVSALLSWAFFQN